MNEYIENLVPVILIGTFCFMVFMVFFVFYVWFDLSKTYLIKAGIGVFSIQIICSIFYVIRARNKHSDKSHKGCEQITNSSNNI